MKMTSIYKLLAIALVGWSTTACDNWLDNVDNTSKIDDEATWDTEEHIDMQVNYFYGYLNSWGVYGGGDAGGNMIEGFCDALKYNHEALGVRAKQAYQYVTEPGFMSPSQNCLSGWSSVYTQVRYINQFLNSMQKFSKFPEEQNTLWEAQARFFRAFSYFHLAKRYDGGIIYDKLPDGPNAPLSTKEELWDFIEQDLDYAIEKLPSKWDDVNAGRIDKIMATAFKCRVMMYAERWQKAYDAAVEVENSKRFSLVSNYANATKGSNSEAIIQFKYDAMQRPAHDFDELYAPVISTNPYQFGSCGVPTQEMVECYETKDGHAYDWGEWHRGSKVRPDYESLEPRFAATIVFPGCTYQGVVMDNSVEGPNGVFQEYGTAAYGWNKTCTGYFLRKLIDESHTDLKNTRSGQTWVTLRYAEILLNKAEAAYHLDMAASEYQTPMNQVRARVGLPGKTSTGDRWFDDYVRERKVELAYEGHLYWDMRRWKLAHEQYNGYRCHGFKIVNGEFNYVEVDLDDRVFDAKTYCFPIPHSEVINNNLVNQFPQWQ